MWPFSFRQGTTIETSGCVAFIIVVLSAFDVPSQEEPGSRTFLLPSPLQRKMHESNPKSLHAKPAILASRPIVLTPCFGERNCRPCVMETGICQRISPAGGRKWASLSRRGRGRSGLFKFSREKPDRGRKGSHTYWKDREQPMRHGPESSASGWGPLAA